MSVLEFLASEVSRWDGSEAPGSPAVLDALAVIVSELRREDEGGYEIDSGVIERAAVAACRGLEGILADDSIVRRLRLERGS
jgi:hypothetical protein